MSNKQYAPQIALQKLNYIKKVFNNCKLSIERTQNLLHEAVQKDPGLKVDSITLVCEKLTITLFCEKLTIDLAKVGAKVYTLEANISTKAGRRTKYFTGLECDVTKLWEDARRLAELTHEKAKEPAVTETN